MAEPTNGTDVVDELTTDHREVAALLDELLETSDPGTRRDMADTAITELVRHSVAEEMYVYPLCGSTCPMVRRRSNTTWRSTRSSSAR